MTFAPTRQLYQDIDAPNILATAGDELPDSVLTLTQRVSCKAEIDRISASRTVHEMMFIANGVEDGARRKRAAENRR